MQVNGSSHLDALRLIHPPKPVSATEPAAKSKSTSSAAPAAGVDRADAYSFEAAYVDRLPRLSYTQAQQRVDRIREQLVAGRTSQPIQFDHSPHALHQPASNPYANPYMKLTPSAAELNLHATEHEA